MLTIQFLDKDGSKMVPGRTAKTDMKDDVIIKRWTIQKSRTTKWRQLALQLIVDHKYRLSSQAHVHLRSSFGLFHVGHILYVNSFFNNLPTQPCIEAGRVIILLMKLPRLYISFQEKIIWSFGFYRKALTPALLLTTLLNLHFRIEDFSSNNTINAIKRKINHNNSNNNCKKEEKNKNKVIKRIHYLIKTCSVSKVLNKT